MSGPRVAVVGPGRLGTLLATAGTRAGWRIAAVVGGGPASRDRFVGRVAGARPHETLATGLADVDLVLLTVPDDALPALTDTLAREGLVDERHRVVHCSGAHGLGTLRRVALTGARVAACHPAVVAPRGADDPDALVGTAWAVTAAPTDRAWAHGFVRDLGGDPHDVAEGSRVLHHAALAVGANAVGAAVVTARRLLAAAGIPDPAPFLEPLVRASVAATLAGGADALTGPVVRGDVGTVARHVEALRQDVPEVLDAYTALARAVLACVRPTLSDATVAAILAALGPDGGPA